MKTFTDIRIGDTLYKVKNENLTELYVNGVSKDKENTTFHFLDYDKSYSIKNEKLERTIIQFDNYDFLLVSDDFLANNICTFNHYFCPEIETAS